MAVSSVHVRAPDRGKSIGDYWPLIALVGASALAAVAMAHGAGDGSMRFIMHAYMGVFLVIFALLKLFDPHGFKRGFAMYDLLARREKRWGLVYPYVELALGLAYLGFVWPVATYLATIAVFAFGAAGVLLGLRRGLDIACPCMGNILSVPLSTVTLTEDLLMVAMAVALLAGMH